MDIVVKNTSISKDSTPLHTLQLNLVPPKKRSVQFYSRVNGPSTDGTICDLWSTFCTCLHQKIKQKFS